ncbi:DUF2996 domain-containing protein [Leptolyngbya sp. FACHB-671]|uniref:DUF2996 domain-containing protein n=1 Tax=Leptolyngbya sp. FACHB-671 TaxID=2692812 RepID=UPI00168360A7|nr:DUF2996 domain-containing protein [Leptolyngbya sp. FACHB-671]MBD1870192.1 DUF2996 domain-containing protein [Cyanobacteria bacterium FACHB-471]MBD2071045.1 DUF2996 domain-containing protein [Leptolyngbya sp. FACHB-671]
MAEEAKSNAGENNSEAKTTELPADGKSEAALTDAAEKPAVSETAQREEVANPAAGNAHTPEVAEDNAPSSDEPEATSLPSANKPDDDPTGPERKPTPEDAKEKAPADEPAAKAAGDKPSPEERKAKAAAAKAAKEKAADGDGDAKPAAKAKKEKPPALEDKPFAEFINQHFLPTLKENLTKQGVQDLDLKFEKQKIPVPGLDENPECWQVIGRLQSGKRQFNVGFLKEDIQASKVFTYSDNGGKASTLESFMIDERRVNLDLLVLYTVQRLNAQKWLVGN